MTRQLRRQWIVGIALVALMFAATAEEPLSAQQRQRAPLSLRALGMGGAAVALPGDDQPFHYNPALMARIKKPRFNILEARVRMNSAMLDYIRFVRNNLQELKKLSDDDPEKQNEILNDALKLAGLRAVMNGDLNLLSFKNPYWGAGLFSHTGGSGQVFAGASGLPVVESNLYSKVSGIVSFATLRQTHSLVELKNKPNHSPSHEIGRDWTLSRSKPWGNVIQGCRECRSATRQ